MKIFKYVGYLVHKYTSKIIYSKAFNKMGESSIIMRPLKLDNPKSISIGDNAYIADFAWLMGSNDKSKGVTLSIGNDVQIGHYFHCVAMHEVKIGNSVLFADKVFVSDCSHGYEDISSPVLSQGVYDIGAVEIGDGAWIGENACIIGVSIGKNSVVGANSVVIKDVPDHTVVAGNPAKIIKRYNMDTKKWEKVEYC